MAENIKIGTFKTDPMPGRWIPLHICEHEVLILVQDLQPESGF